MAWKIKWDPKAEKELLKLSHPIQKDILRYLDTRIEGSKNPRLFGETLSGNKAGLWRYRVGDYRIICEFEDDHCIVVVIAVGHRKEIYED